MSSAMETNPPPNAAHDAIVVSHLIKQFRVRHQGGSLKGALLNRGRNAPRTETSTILNDLSFTVPHGQTLAVIGRNGSGKSTLLSLLARVYRPTSGTIGLHGPEGTPARIAPLLALGAGFHPDLSGLDNIVFYGAILGLSPKEIRAKQEAILDFAELEDKADTALYNWNDGAKLRLGFAIAVHTDPDILLVDEVLAVGDEAFQNKCYRFIGKLQREGKTILFVSHDLAVVERVAGRVLWLHNGVIRRDGDAGEILAAYRENASLDADG